MAFCCGVGAIVYGVAYATEAGFNWGWPFWACLCLGGIIGGYGNPKEWVVAPVSVAFGLIIGMLGYAVFRGELINPFLLPMLCVMVVLPIMVTGPCALIGMFMYGAIHPDLPMESPPSPAPPEPSPQRRDE
jgi:hypothetical protein